MQELEVTWQRVARIWWLIVWRALLGGTLLGAAIGFIIGFIGALRDRLRMVVWRLEA